MKATWTPDEIALLRQHYRRMPAEKLQALLQRSAPAIRAKANSLGLSGDRHRPVSQIEWTDDELALLGKVPDAELGKLKGVSLDVVRRKRVSLNIPATVPVVWHQWTDEEAAQLGTMPDASLGKKLGRSLGAVRAQRLRLGIPAFAPHTKWTPEMDALLGKSSDKTVAHKLNVSLDLVRQRRSRLGIPAHPESQTAIHWPASILERLGAVKDSVLAREAGIPARTITRKRKQLGIPRYRTSKKPRLAPASARPEWRTVMDLSQPDFYRAISAHHLAATGQPLTYAALSELCLWPASRLQEWLTFGSNQQPMALPVRHHIWLAVCHGITARDPS
ncbi:hypothetical protein [Chromobacterium haemolyticum]|uniref:Uncharacterized protein n=1 Tax=Chromobacterium haemolyticum TaxID=394935 RepID=A0A1W0CNV7_9NEIS|nr:hypothetical protein [Chromobacterium haemolyticum]OQS36494.1 hypothetical protein B0T45_15610 [Chromobacterium haemolyticum]